MLCLHRHAVGSTISSIRLTGTHSLDVHVVRVYSVLLLFSLATSLPQVPPASKKYKNKRTASDRELEVKDFSGYFLTNIHSEPLCAHQQTARIWVVLQCCA